MGINRIKYVNVNSAMEDSDFVTYSGSKAILQPLYANENKTYYPTGGIDGWNEVVVDVPVPQYYREYEITTVGTNLVLNRKSVTETMDLSTITSIGSYALAYTYAQTNITEVSIPELKTINNLRACYGTFLSCQYLTSFSAPKLQQIANSYSAFEMFSECSALVNINLPALYNITGDRAAANMFNGCGIVNLSLPTFVGVTSSQATDACFSMFANNVNLESVDMPLLQRIQAGYAFESMFEGCPKLVSVNMPLLRQVNQACGLYRTFRNCPLLTELRFPSLTPSGLGTTYHNQFIEMCFGIPSITLHFPKNTQSIIETMTGYNTVFGATSGTILFDLPSTVTLKCLTGLGETISLNRRPDKDTSTALGWSQSYFGDENIRYTSGLQDPVIDDWVYQDPECTEQWEKITDIV